MLRSQQKYLPYLLLLLFSVPLFFINVHDLHSWGDDFAQYIKEAQNIATGKPYYQSNYIFNKYNPVYAPPQYPPGFPLLLAPVVKIWGLSFIAMYYFNSFITACLLFVLFAYFRKRQAGPVASLCLATMVTYSHIILDLKGNVLADIPCLLFVTIYLVYREANTYSWKRIILLIFFASMAIQIRSQAIFILAAEALLLFFSLIKFLIKERRSAVRKAFISPSLFIIAGVLLINLLLDKIIFYTPASTTSFYNDFIHAALSGSMIGSAKEYLVYLFQVIPDYFYCETSNGFFNAVGYFIGYAGLVFGVTGFLLNIWKRLAFDDLFFIIVCILIIYYPVRDHRYFLPVLPILFYYCYTTFKIILLAAPPVNARIVAIVLTIIFLRSEYGYIKTLVLETRPGLIPQQKDLVAFRYISQHVNDRDIIIFTKPRALTLFTNKKSMNISWQLSQQMNKEIFDSMWVKYVLVIDGFDDSYFKTYFNDVQHPVDSVKISEGYTLYSLR